MPDESVPTRPTGDQIQLRGRERALATLATRQHGVVTWQQLLGLGLGKDAIAYRLRMGRLHRLHPGVYAFGHRAMRHEAAWMAAVLAAGEEAVLSHVSAACLWGLMDCGSQRHDVTVPQSSRSTSSLCRHRSALLADEISERQGIRVTCVARTLFDLATCVRPWEFERCVREAEVLRLPQRPSLEELYARHPRRRGAQTVRLVLEELSRMSGGKTRSPLEDRFLRFVAKVGLPPPETNVVLRFGQAKFEADCLWREAGLIVELDGHQAHGTRFAFESDRERDRLMQADGWRVIRVTSRQLRRPDPLARDLRRLLA